MPLIISTIIPNSTRSKKQSGAALLVFLLLIIVSASTLLLNRLNSSIKRSVYNPAISIELEEAKIALLSWAVNHTVNPGILPMPDRNSDGDYDGDSDCYNGGAISNNLLLGRIPWKEYPSPCKDSASLSGLSMYPGVSTEVDPVTGTPRNLYQDATGRVLWYAVSHNLVYETPEYPVVSPGTSNSSTGWITVRDSGGVIISNRVAFVVIAPGPALSPYNNCFGTTYTGQDRSGTAPAIQNFLDSVTINSVTYSNADYDQDFIMYPNSVVTNDGSSLEQCDQFNDQLVFVTIDELMDAVSKRVLNETANALTAYHNTYGALPWLAPFADPKSDSKHLVGEATSASSNLVDTSVDFTDWGVTNGDVVWNLTDGSRGIVTSVSANTLTIGAGLKLGTNNTFAVNNEYYVEIMTLADTLRSVATANTDSNGLTLENTSRDFVELGVKVGDVIDNITDGSRGIVTGVSTNRITVGSLTGGTANQFAINNSYRIRSNVGKATADTDTNGFTLDNTNVNFTTMGIQSGDLVHNISDGSFGTVTTPITANRLTVGGLKYGTSNTFSNNNYYSISRFKGRANTRIGFVPVHHQGELFPTQFSVDWYSPNSGGSVTTTLATDSTYTTALRNWAGASSGYSGTVTLSEANAKCTWISHEFVRCKGVYEDATDDFLSGTATTGSTSLALRDSTTDFSTLGTKRGDKVRNITDGTTGIVFNTSSTQLTLVNINGMSNVSIDVGDNYEIDLATSSFTFVAAAGTNTTRVNYPVSVNESLFQADDTLENMAGSTSIGRITSINTTLNYVVYSTLQGGGYTDVVQNETVRIRHNFVNKREYEFDVTLKGTAAEQDVSDVRKRSVCAGYDTSCTTAGNNTTLKGDGATAFVTIHDYEGAVEVGKATNILPVAGLSSRSLKVSGLNYFLNDECRDNDNDCTDLDYDCGNVNDKCRDLPEWFVRNKWYQYVIVAYSNGEAPLISTCTAGTDCLTLNLRNAANTIMVSRNNVRALVMVAREGLSGQSWANATVTDYFDDAANTSLADNIFERHPESGTFNDLIRIAISCPSDTSKLCWSN